MGECVCGGRCIRFLYSRELEHGMGFFSYYFGEECENGGKMGLVDENLVPRGFKQMGDIAKTCIRIWLPNT